MKRHIIIDFLQNSMKENERTFWTVKYLKSQPYFHDKASF